MGKRRRWRDSCVEIEIGRDGYSCYRCREIQMDIDVERWRQT